MSRNVRVLNNRVLEIIYLKLLIYDLLDKVFFTLQVRSEMSWDTLKKPPMPSPPPKKKKVYQTWLVKPLSISLSLTLVGKAIAWLVKPKLIL